MVHINDEGSQFDVPIETVWRYLAAGEDHGTGHKNSRNMTTKNISENIFLLSQERKMGNQWVKITSRIALYPLFSPLRGENR